MLDRLKSLPLTIVLSILIWMYAESQFTATREGVDMSVRVEDVGNEYAVTLRNREGQWRENIPLELTVQGPQALVEDLYDQALARKTPDPEFLNFRIPLPTDQLRPGTETTIDTVRMLNQHNFFRSRGLTVLAAQPPQLQLQVVPRATAKDLTIDKLPVNLSATPEFVNTYDVQITPNPIQIVIAGPGELLRPIEGANARGTVEDHVRAYVDLRSSDRPTGQPITRPLRFVLPEGTKLLSGPKEVQLRIINRPPPADTPPTTNTQPANN